MTCRKSRRLISRMLALIGLLSLLAPGAAFADTLYIQAKSAKLRAGKTSLDRVVADVAYGEAVDLVSRDKDWVEVRTAKGVTGWIFANKIGPTRPAGGGGALAALGKSLRRSEAGEVTASAGARGLDKASETYANKTGITKEHRDAVDRMTAYRIGDEDVEAFLKDGKLGEYAQ